MFGIDANSSGEAGKFEGETRYEDHSVTSQFITVFPLLPRQNHKKANVHWVSCTPSSGLESSQGHSSHQHLVFHVL